MAVQKHLLFMACESNDLELIKECITAGYNVNEKNLYGETPLMLLISRNFEYCLDSVQYLVENGADINIADYDGRNALNYCYDLIKKDNNVRAVYSYLQEKSAKCLDNRSNDNSVTISTLQSQIKNDENLSASATKEFINTFDSRGFSPFMWSIWYQNLHYFNYYILMGADVNLRNPDGKTPLMIACCKFNKEIVKLLLAKGASINESDAAGNSVLSYYMHSHEYAQEDLKYLLDEGADINSCGRNGKTPLIWASIFRKTKFVLNHVPEKSDPLLNDKTIHRPFITKSRVYKHNGILIRSTASAPVAIMSNSIEKHGNNYLKLLKLDKCDSEGNTALGYLAYHNEKQAISTLLSLDKSVRIDACGTKGRTALSWAITRNHFDLFEFLVKNGAKLSHIDFQGNTPLSYARRYNRSDMIDYLLKNGAVDPREYPLTLITMKSKQYQSLLDLIATSSELETTLLYLTIKENNFDCLKFLIQNGIKCYQKEKNGNTPLIYAIQQENIAMIKYLLENGAKPTVHSAFSTALETENLEIIKLLIENGVKVNRVDADKGSPLDQAIGMGNEDIFKFLLESGATPNFDENPSLVNKLLKFKQFPFVKCLIENGAKINDKDLDQHPSPLRDAIRLNNLENAKYFIENGANVCEIFKDEESLLQLAVESKNIELVKLLIGKNSEVLKISNRHTSPLRRAIQMNNSLLIDYLINQGADVNETDEITNKNLLTLAIENENFSLAINLILHGADIEGSRKELEAFATTDPDFEEFLKDLNVKISLDLIEKNIADMKKKLVLTINNK